MLDEASSFLLQFILINGRHDLLILVFQLHSSLQVLINRFSFHEIFNQGNLTFLQCLLQKIKGTIKQRNIVGSSLL